MMNKIKTYLEYTRNKRIAKRELAKITAAALPVIREVSDQTVDIANFIMKLAKETKNISDEKFVEMVLSEVSAALQTNPLN